MPKFLETKLKREYGEKSAIPYKVMNTLGAMHGNKETAKGARMEQKHEADVKTGKAESMREMRVEIHRGPKGKVTGFTVHHNLMPKISKSHAFSEDTTESHRFGGDQHEAMIDHIHKHTAAQLEAAKEKPYRASAAEEEAEGEEA